MRITGTGVALPKMVVNNDRIAEFLDTSDEWIASRTGIRERHVVSDETMIELGAEAARKAIADSGLNVSDIDFIICSKLINTYITPSLSCIIQGEIGATCPCVDINIACSGFLAALELAGPMIDCGKYKNILIVCAEETSRIVDWSSRNTCILFGDAATGVVVSPGKGVITSMMSTKSMTDVLYHTRRLLDTPFLKKEEKDLPLEMNGREIFKNAVRASVADIKEVLSRAKMSVADIDIFVLHQANLRIIESIRQQLDLPEEKVPHNVEKYGNTSSASIPLLLDELLKAGKIKDGDKVLFSAFGAGFATAACIMEWHKN